MSSSSTSSLQELAVALRLLEIGVRGRELLVQLHQPAIAELRGPGEVTVALGSLGLATRVLDLAFIALMRPMQSFSQLQCAFIASISSWSPQLLLDLVQPLRGLVRLLVERRFLDLELLRPPVEHVVSISIKSISIPRNREAASSTRSIALSEGTGP